VHKILLLLLLCVSSIAKAQKIDSIYVHLYTDSLKKGTFNYINIDGLLANGRYMPLDSSHISFSSSAGKFYGNTLWLDKDCKEDKVAIKAVLRSNPALHKEFVVFIKKKEDEQLRSLEDIMNTPPQKGKKKKN
jgi:hypothetical protein